MRSAVSLQMFSIGLLLTASGCTYEALRLTAPSDGAGLDDGGGDTAPLPTDGPDLGDLGGIGDGRGDGPSGADHPPTDGPWPTDGPTATDSPPPTCLDTEGADTPAEAVVLSSTLVGDLCADDQDWYRFAVDSNDVLRLTIDATPPLALAVELLDCDSQALFERCPRTANNGTWACEFSAPATGTLCLGLWLGASNPTAVANYSARVTFIPSPTCAVDPYEENDTLAFPFPAGAPSTSLTQGTLCASDPDWFEISTSGSEDALLVEVLSRSTATLLLRPTDCASAAPVEGLLCRVDPAEPARHQCAVHFATPLPSYCVEVYSDTAVDIDGAPYELEARPRLPCGDDTAEPNNDEDEPYVLAAGAGQAFAICDLDVDWYSYAATGAGNASLTLQWVDPNSQIILGYEWWLPGASTVSSYCVGTPTPSPPNRSIQCMPSVVNGAVYRLKVYILTAPPGIAIDYSLVVLNP